MNSRSGSSRRGRSKSPFRRRRKADELMGDIRSAEQEFLAPLRSAMSPPCSPQTRRPAKSVTPEDPTESAAIEVVLEMLPKSKSARSLFGKKNTAPPAVDPHPPELNTISTISSSDSMLQQNNTKELSKRSNFKNKFMRSTSFQSPNRVDDRNPLEPKRCFPFNIGQNSNVVHEEELSPRTRKAPTLTKWTPESHLQTPVRTKNNRLVASSSQTKKSAQNTPSTMSSHSRKSDSGKKSMSQSRANLPPRRRPPQTVTTSRSPSPPPRDRRKSNNGVVDESVGSPESRKSTRSSRNASKSTPASRSISPISPSPSPIKVRHNAPDGTNLPTVPKRDLVVPKLLTRLASRAAQSNSALDGANPSTPSSRRSGAEPPRPEQIALLRQKSLFSEISTPSEMPSNGGMQEVRSVLNKIQVSLDEATKQGKQIDKKIVYQTLLQVTDSLDEREEKHALTRELEGLVKQANDEDEARAAERQLLHGWKQPYETVKKVRIRSPAKTMLHTSLDEDMATVSSEGSSHSHVSKDTINFLGDLFNLGTFWTNAIGEFNNEDDDDDDDWTEMVHDLRHPRHNGASSVNKSVASIYSGSKSKASLASSTTGSHRRRLDRSYSEDTGCTDEESAFASHIDLSMYSGRSGNTGRSWWRNGDGVSTTSMSLAPASVASGPRMPSPTRSPISRASPKTVLSKDSGSKPRAFSPQDPFTRTRSPIVEEDDVSLSSIESGMYNGSTRKPKQSIKFRSQDDSVLGGSEYSYPGGDWSRDDRYSPHPPQMSPRSGGRGISRDTDQIRRSKSWDNRRKFGQMRSDSKDSFFR